MKSQKDEKAKDGTVASAKTGVSSLVEYGTRRCRTDTVKHNVSHTHTANAFAFPEALAPLSLAACKIISHLICVTPVFSVAK